MSNPYEVQEIQEVIKDGSLRSNEAQEIQEVIKDGGSRSNRVKVGMTDDMLHLFECLAEMKATQSKAKAKFSYLGFSLLINCFRQQFDIPINSNGFIDWAAVKKRGGVEEFLRTTGDDSLCTGI